MVKKIQKRRGSSKKTVIIQIIIIFLISFLSLFGYFAASSDFFGKKIISPVPLAKSYDKSMINAIKNINQSDLEKLKTDLLKNNISFVDISASSDGSLNVLLSSDQNVIFSPKKDIDFQISSLQLIMSRFTIEGRRFSRLDFRFDKPVISVE